MNETTTKTIPPKPNLNPTAKPARPYRFRRNLLRDALEIEQVVHLKCTQGKIGAINLASLVRAFTALVPVIRALQGRSLVLSATMRADLDPVRMAKQLKSMRKRVNAGPMLDLPQSFIEAGTTEGKSEKESLSAEQG